MSLASQALAGVSLVASKLATLQATVTAQVAELAAVETRRQGPPGVGTSVNRAFVSTDPGKAVRNSSASLLYFQVPVSTAATIATDAEITVQGGRGGAVLAPTYFNGLSNPKPSVSQVTTGYGTRGATTIAINAAGVRCTSTATGSIGAIGESVPLTTLGVAPLDRISARSLLTLDANVSVAGIVFRWLGNGVTLSESTRNDTAGSGVRYLTNIQIPAGTDAVQIIYYATATAVGATLDINESMVSPTYGISTALPSYADGSTAGCAWTGTANASPSMGPTIRGERNVPANTESKLRYYGGNVWSAALAGTAPDVLKRTDVLFSDKRNGQAGYRCPDERMAQVNLTLAANRVYGSRFYASTDGASTIIGFFVKTPSSTDDRVEVGIYTGSGTKVTSITATGRLNSAGYKTITISTSRLTAGQVYYACIGTATAGAVIGAVDIIPNGFGSAAPQLESFYFDATLSTTTTAFPTTLPTLTGQAAAPLLWVRE